MEDYFELCERATKRISSLGGLHSEEALILQAIILVNSSDNVWQKKEQNELKDNLLSILTKKAFDLSTPTSPSTSSILRVQNLLLMLPCIKEANMVMDGMWAELRGQIDASNKLLIEMIDR